MTHTGILVLFRTVDRLTDGQKGGRTVGISNTFFIDLFYNRCLRKHIFQVPLPRYAVKTLF